MRVPRNPYAQPRDYKHNMLSLLYATCLKLLVFLFSFVLNSIQHFSKKRLPYASVRQHDELQQVLVGDNHLTFGMQQHHEI